MNYFFVWILLHIVVATPQINLYLTHLENEERNATRYHCLRLAAAADQWNINRQIISYCITHSLSKSSLEKNEIFFPKFTFVQLSQANITSQQLYLWSAPIDLIEEYQFYLDQRSTFNDSTLATTRFVNCTLPRFGLSCEYEFDYYHPDHTSLYEMIYDFYGTFPYYPVELTCYMHLKCDRGPYPMCLDWTEICDGKIDCHNGGVDEEHCWQLEINECADDEYRCMNGQCIPRSLYQDDSVTPDCLDRSDEERVRFYLSQQCDGKEPSLMCEDIACTSMPLTSCCLRERSNLLVNGLFSVKDDNITDECWLVFKCALDAPKWMDPICSDYCMDGTYASIIDRTCPEMLLIPAVPVLFNEVYFAYRTNESRHLACGKYWSPFRCFTTTRYDESFFTETKLTVRNTTCSRDFKFIMPTDALIIPWMYSYVIPAYLDLQKYIFLWNYSSTICDRSSMYQCLNSSKCISVSRLMNGIDDCPYADDEDMTKNTDLNAIDQMKRNSFHCQAKNKYIPLTSLEDGKCDCTYADTRWCEDENPKLTLVRRNISFQTICDGFTELAPILIDGRNETDETECEHWLCDNIYTRCNGLWNCRNGEDEIGCYPSLSVTCSFNEHFCVSNRTFELVCLPIEKVNDGRIDCVGATDERSFCHRTEVVSQANNFYCVTNSSTGCLNVYTLCDLKSHCVFGDDEQFCQKNASSRRPSTICQSSRSINLTETEQFLCDYTSQKVKEDLLFFTLEETKNLSADHLINPYNVILPSKSLINRSVVQDLNCHRGLDLRLWFNDKKNLTNITCLCPPSYYGDRCQYQNQRISLSIQFRVSSHSHQTPFAILISLIDHNDNRLIHSHEQFTYLSIRDCKVKFSVYLLYSTRPKDPNRNFSIQIDIYDKISLNHRGSVFIPIQFSVLPVHRLSRIVDIPDERENIQQCLDQDCHHGRCLHYFRSPHNDTFCQCDQGWSGRSCTIPYTSQCSSNAVCVGVDVNNRSICICPLHRFGPRCLLRHLVCSRNDTCQNGGLCVPDDDFSPFDEQFTCVCPRGYIGKRCETTENGLRLFFAKDVISTPSIFIHFIRLLKDDRPQRATTLRTIPFRQDSLFIQWSQPFHLVFIEFTTRNYYFILTENVYNRSPVISRTVNLSHRCRHISELFNESVVKLHLLRRIKYYQLPCQTSGSDLSCFYDDIHMCLCRDHRRHRVANCFEFNHNMTFNCRGRSACQNDAQCFQDTPDCPQRSMCVCPACYYGTRCQFTTAIFSLSLDAILGYHIQQHIKLTQQPSIVQVSIALTIVFILIGLANGILSLLTFKNKVTRNVGCGYYLLGISVTNILMTTIFGLKFWILLLAQIQVITNRSFLSFQCHSVDYLLRCSLNMDQWLNACVAVERAITMVIGARFNKRRSKQVAKWMICILAIFIISTGLDDPIYRGLIDEENEDERRIWCVVSYPSSVQKYNTTMNIFHFVTPFLLNLISAVVLIIQKSRQKAALENDRSYNIVLRRELRQYKHLLIAPVVLVILATPHLILSFASKCMKFNSSSGLFLALYLISFVPPMLTFAIFIIPSKFYKRELRSTISRYRRTVSRRVNTMALRSTTIH